MEGRLFVPLGIAFIVSTLASLVVSVTVTPVLSFYLLPSMKSLDHGDTKLLAWLKASYGRSLQAVLNRPKAALAAGAALPFWWQRSRCPSSPRPSCRPSTRERC